MPWAYILRCADASLYVGATADLSRRLARHQHGTAAVHTATRRPVTLVFAEEHPTLRAAVARERQIKRWTRAKKEALLKGDLVLLKQL